MDTSTFPTKGNLILAKNTLKLSMSGYELLDKKRNILTREMMELIDIAKEIQGRINSTFTEAYEALQTANITLGISNVEQIGHATHIQDSVIVKFKSVMGVEIPVISMGESKNFPNFGLYRTSSSLDKAYIGFNRALKMAKDLAQIENSIQRLAVNIKKTQKRANALKNVIIPKYQEIIRNIQNSLEEKEREEFSRLKRIKNLSADNNIK